MIKLKNPNTLDTLRVIDYGELGITVELTYGGEMFDIGLSPDQANELEDWLAKR